MYDHRGKIGGAIIATLALLIIITERVSGITMHLGRLDNTKLSAIFEWLLLVGLFLMVFSKEKNNEEQASKIRLKAFQIAFGVSHTVILGVALCVAFSTKLVIGSSELFSIASIGILIYLIFFHFGLYFEDLWETENVGLWQNLKSLKKNKMSVLAYFILCIIFFALLIIIMLI